MSTDTPDARLEAMRAQLQAELAKSPKARPWWVEAVGLVALNVALIACALLLLSSPASAQSTPMARFVATAGLIALIAGGTFFGLRPGSRGPRQVMLGFGTVAMVLAVLSGSDIAVDGPFWAGTSCATIESLVALVPVVAAVLVLSRFAFDPLRTTVVGMSSAAVGVFALHLHCPNGSWAHLAMFHAGPWGLLLAAMFFARRSMPSKTFAP